MSPKRGRGFRGSFSTRGANSRRRAARNPMAKKLTAAEIAPEPVGAVTTSIAGENVPVLRIKVLYMPDIYNAEDFGKYVSDRFGVSLPKVVSPVVNNPYVVLEITKKADHEKLLKDLAGHVWRTKKLEAVDWTCVDMEEKDLVPHADAMIIRESLPLLDISYEDQNRLSVKDAEQMAQRLHGSLCGRNPALAGWAEKSCETNNGFLFKIEPLKICKTVQGYKNKCKFRIGKNSDGETAVGFGLNDNNNRILGVEPGDKFIHLPDSMKYAAKKFQEFLRSTGKEPYDKKTKTGIWENLLIRVAPEGALMLIAMLAPKTVNTDEIPAIKQELKEFFESGEGKDCNVFSLYLHIFKDQQPGSPGEKLDLLMGEPDYEENISGLKFYVSPFSILNINPSSSENIYNSVIELAEPTLDSVVIDVCAGSCGIAFTFANKVEKAYAIERKEENIRDALKTKELNNITNVDIIEGKCEDRLGELFTKLKDKPLIVILDPPRHGVVAKTVAQIREQPNVKKVIYVCSNSRTGMKNFLDFAAQDGREQGSGIMMQGLPFLPVRAIPIDVAPFTASNTITLLLERVDPQTFPAAKKPPPSAPQEVPPRKRHGSLKRRRPDGPPMRKNPAAGRPPVRVDKGPMPKRPRFPNRPFASSAPSPRPLLSGMVPPPIRRVGPRNQGGYLERSSLIQKYERRIAELEQQDRAFRAGLSMGLQVGNRGFPSENPRRFPSDNNRGFQPDNNRGFPPDNSRGFQPEKNRGFPPENDRGFPPDNSSGFPPENNRGFPPDNSRGFPLDNNRGFPPDNNRGFPSDNNRRFPPDNNRRFPLENNRGMTSGNTRGMSSDNNHEFPPDRNRSMYSDFFQSDTHDNDYQESLTWPDNGPNSSNNRTGLGAHVTGKYDFSPLVSTCFFGTHAFEHESQPRRRPESGNNARRIAGRKTDQRFRKEASKRGRRYQ